VGVSACASARAGVSPRPRAAPVTPLLQERHPCPELSVSQGSGQVCAQHPMLSLTPPVNSSSPAMVAPTKTPLSLCQQSLTSRGSSLGGTSSPCCIVIT